MKLNNVRNGFVVLFVVVGSFLLLACGTGPSTTYTSPDSRFRVEIVDEYNIIDNILGGQRTFFSLYDGENALAKHELLAHKDYHAGSFSKQYPGSSWMTDSTLRIEHVRQPDTSETDKLFINNKSGRPIRFLVVQFGDFVIVHNIAADERRILEVRRTGVSWLAVQGKFGDGQEIKGRGVDFFNRDDNKTVRFCVKLLDSGIELGSSNIVGYESGVDVPLLQNCD